METEHYSWHESQRNNQNFVGIAFAKLIEMIEYKAKEIGISIVEQDESHTSKCSFLDNEPIGHSGKYVGKRISRGLFRSSTGIIIMKAAKAAADVQGAYNIIKKAFPKAFMNLQVVRSDGIEDGEQLKLSVGLHPIRINPLRKQYH